MDILMKCAELFGDDEKVEYFVKCQEPKKALGLLNMN